MTLGIKSFILGVAVGGAVVGLTLVACGGVFQPGQFWGKQSTSTTSGQRGDIKATCQHIADVQATDSARLESIWKALNGAWQAPSQEAMESTVLNDLQTVRSQVELYKVQHMDKAPSPKSYADQLTCRTNQEGQALSPHTADADHPYGPYLQHFPSNPFIADKTVADKIKFGHSHCPFDGTTGWYVNLDDNTICPNDATHKNTRY